MSDSKNSIANSATGEYDIVQQLLALKDLTVRFGCIEEVQKRQLVGYGQIIPNVIGNSVVAHINIDNKIVHIKVDSEKTSSGKSKFRQSKRVKELFPKITEWVRFILWDSAVVMISVDQIIVWDSRNVRK